MASPVGSMSNLDEKKDVITTGGKHENHPEIDLTHYHEQRAGRLVLDPRCVPFFPSPWFPLPITHMPERRKLSSETKFPHASSFPQTERSSSGLSPQMIRKTLKTSVHTRKSDYDLIDLITFSGPNGGRPSNWQSSHWLRSFPTSIRPSVSVETRTVSATYH